MNFFFVFFLCFKLKTPERSSVIAFSLQLIPRLMRRHKQRCILELSSYFPLTFFPFLFFFCSMFTPFPLHFPPISFHSSSSPSLISFIHPCPINPQNPIRSTSKIRIYCTDRYTMNKLSINSARDPRHPPHKNHKTLFLAPSSTPSYILVIRSPP